jgi:AcrR family transcriptional regulator
VPDRSKHVLIWQRMRGSATDRKLTYERIVDAAMELADKSGLEGLSMRGLAKRLDAGTMTLYRYVADRDDLLDLILDRAFGEIAVPVAVRKDWRKDIILVAVATRGAMIQHSWLSALLIRRPTLGPNYLLWYEFLLKATSSICDRPEKQLEMIGVIWAFTLGSVTYELGEMENNRRNGLTEGKKRRIAEPYLKSAIDTGIYPQLAKVLASPRRPNAAEAFRSGLDAILDGLIQQIGRRQNSSQRSIWKKPS